MTAAKSVFADHLDQVFTNKYACTLHVAQLVGGVPSNPDVIRGWIESQVEGNDKRIQRLIAETLEARGVTPADASPEERQAAIDEVAGETNVNGFMRDENGLYVEGRIVKACIKEAASVALAAGNLKLRGWGRTNKGLLSFLAEHVIVPERRIHLGRQEPDGTRTSFVHTWRSDSIKREDYVEDVDLSFSVWSDVDFEKANKDVDDFWPVVWTTAETAVGLGASRSQGFGRFTVVRWDPIA